MLHSASIVLLTSGVAHVVTVEEALLTEALRRADGHQDVAAMLLGLSRQALNKRLHRHQPPGRTADPAEWPA